MPVSELVLRYVQALVWPAVVVGFYLRFPGPIGRLIDRIRSISAGPISVLADEAVAITASLPSPPPPAPATRTATVTDSVGITDEVTWTMYRNVDGERVPLSPTPDAFLRWWSLIEQESRKFATYMRMVRPISAIDVSKVLRHAHDRQLLSLEAVELADVLRRARNEIVHGGASDSTAANLYVLVRSAARLFEILREATTLLGPPSNDEAGS